MIVKSLNKLLVISVILFSCQSNTIKTCELEYDYEVKTLNSEKETEINRTKFKKDILYIVLASTFNNRTVNIYRNGELFKQLSELETDPIDGITMELQMSKRDLNNIGFQIDNGNLIFVDFCNEPSNFITFNFDNKKAVVNKMNHPPTFY